MKIVIFLLFSILCVNARDEQTNNQRSVVESERGIVHQFFTFIGDSVQKLYNRVFTRGDVQRQYVDFCYGKYDGTYCNGYFLYQCFGQRTVTYQQCTFCTQSSPYAGTCSSYQVPATYCSTKVNGWSCYAPFGSSIYTSVWCDNRNILQQQVCGSGFSSCDSFSGRCTGSTGSTIGSTTQTCSPSCSFGCNFDGSCKQAPYCGLTQLVNPNSAPFCASYVSGRTIDSKLSVPLQDQNANTLNSLLSTFGNVTYSSSCLTFMKQFTCESNFLNCAEKQSKFASCQVVCQNACKCMQTENSGAVSPINCITSCSSASFLTVVSSMMLLLFLAVCLL